VTASAPGKEPWSTVVSVDAQGQTITVTVPVLRETSTVATTREPPRDLRPADLGRPRFPLFAPDRVPEAAPDSEPDCGSTQSDPLHCGACNHSCLKGGCDGGRCLPFPLVRDILEIGSLGLAIAGDTLIATPYQDGDMLLVDRTSGNFRKLLDGTAGSVHGLATDGTHVYWIEGATRTTYSLRHCALSGCPANGPDILIEPFSGYLPDLRLHGGHLYFATNQVVDGGNVDAIERCALDGTGRETLVPGRPFENIDRVTMDATHLYWGEKTGLVRAPIVGLAPGQAPEPVGGNSEISGIGLDAQWIVWGESDALYGLPRSAIGTSQQPTLLAPAQDNVRSIGFHGGYVYWSAFGYFSTGFQSAIRRCVLTACSTTIETIASGVQRASALVVDDRAVYYSEAGNNQGSRGSTIWRWAH
jgi:hypothetical protein